MLFSFSSPYRIQPDSELFLLPRTFHCSALGQDDVKGDVERCEKRCVLLQNTISSFAKMVWGDPWSLPPGSKLFDFRIRVSSVSYWIRSRTVVFVPNTAPRRRLREMDVKFSNVKRGKMDTAPFSICWVLCTGRNPVMSTATLNMQIWFGESKFFAQNKGYWFWYRALYGRHVRPCVRLFLS